MKRFWQWLKKRPVYYLILAPVPAVRVWPFYGQAVKARELFKCGAKWGEPKGWPHPGMVQEYLAKINHELKTRSQLLREHRQAVLDLEKDIALLQEALPPKQRERAA